MMLVVFLYWFALGFFAGSTIGVLMNAFRNHS